MGGGGGGGRGMWGNVQLSPFNTKPLFEWEFQRKFEVVVHSLCCLIKVCMERYFFIYLDVIF